MNEVMFFSNGNTAFFKDGKQVPELQESWLLIYVNFLKEKGYIQEDIEQIKINLPDGNIAKIEGNNWRIE